MASSAAGVTDTDQSRAVAALLTAEQLADAAGLARVVSAIPS